MARCEVKKQNKKVYCHSRQRASQVVHLGTGVSCQVVNDCIHSVTGKKGGRGISWEAMGQSQLAQISACVISFKKKTHWVHIHTADPPRTHLANSLIWFHPLCFPHNGSFPPTPSATHSLLYRDSINPTFPRWYLSHSGFPQKLICPDNRTKDWSPGIAWHIPFKPSTIINRRLIRTVLKDHTEERPRID